MTSGERIETILTIEAKNDYDYLMFEDLKPAGFEAVEVRSGECLGRPRTEIRRGETEFRRRTNVHEIKPGESLPWCQAYGISIAALERANRRHEPAELADKGRRHHHHPS